MRDSKNKERLNLVRHCERSVAISNRFFNMKKNILLFSIVFFTPFFWNGAKIHAQDIHFSQFNETPQLLNPGATGVYSGYIRAIANYKNQWAAMGNAFNTVASSVDMPLFDKNEKKAHLGVGLNFFSDKAGDSKFGLTQVNLCIAGILPVDAKGSKLSMGVSIGGAQHKATLAGLQWGSQYDGAGFNTAMSTNEALGVNSFTYFDLGAGLFYQYLQPICHIIFQKQKNIFV